MKQFTAINKMKKKFLGTGLKSVNFNSLIRNILTCKKINAINEGEAALTYKANVKIK